MNPYEAIENAQRVNDAYEWAKSEDPARNQIGLIGGAVGASLLGSIGGLVSLGDPDFIAAGALAGGIGGSELAEKGYDALGKYIADERKRNQNNELNKALDLLPDNPSGGGSGGTPNGPFPEPDPLRRHDPLALDMNQDGEISTVSIDDSTAFFDLTGDGIKEKVGWIQAVDGLVAYDKNGNGKIDGINEVFGTATTSGFAELRAIADSNNDGVIDRRDELYNQLKVWQDLNQDGISQSNELRTLHEAGVTKIELDVFATNINLNGNLLSEAGRHLKSNSTQRKVA